MCGLIGYASTEKFATRDQRRDFLYEGFIVSMGRGYDASGVAVVEKDKEKEQPYVYKDNICGFDFVRRQYMDNLLTNIDDYTMVMGHTRSGTRGSGARHNAHPFQHNHITLTHNGTIENPYQWLPKTTKPNEIVVDSHQLTWALGEQTGKEDEIALLERLTGAYALVWHNTKDGSLNFARNDKKPLHFAYVEHQNTMCWASEYNALVYLMERHGLKIEDMPIWPGPHKWYKFFLDDLRRTRAKKEEFVRPFVPSTKARHGPGSQSSQSTNGTDTTSTKDTGTTTTKWKEATPEELSTMRREIGKWDDVPRDLADVKDWLRANPKHPIFKQRGVPSSAKKIQQAIRDLSEFKLTFGKTLQVYPTLYKPYPPKKNKPTVGEMTAFTPSGIACVMTSVSPEKFEAYQRCSKIFTRAIATRKTGEDTAVVVVEHETHPLRQMYVNKNWGVSKSGEDKPEPPGEVELVPGPGANKIPVERFNNLVERGCCYCTGDISPEDADDLIWLGNDPVCPTCANDHEVMVFLGLIFEADGEKREVHH